MKNHNSYRQFDPKPAPTLARTWPLGLALGCVFLTLLASPMPSATAQDTTPPYLECGGVQATIDEGWCDAIIPYAFNVYYDDPSATLTGVRSDGRPLNAPYLPGSEPPEFPGTTTVTWTLTDAAGNSSTCLQDILVFIPEGYGCPLPRSLKTQLRDAVIAVRSTATTDLSKFTAAINYLNKSIDPNRWLDDSHPKPGKAGEPVFSNEKSAASQLTPLRPKYPALVPILYRLVDVDREIAEIAIAEAKARGGSASKIAAAENYLIKGDADVAVGKFPYAIDDYKNAWKNAVGA